MTRSVPISVIIPTFNRPEELKNTIQQILTCEPRPSEILVHVDAGDFVTEAAISDLGVNVITSQTRQGPGGGRNKLTDLAENEYIASFDDDSWPLSQQFFVSALELFERHPSIAMFAADIIEGDGQSGSAYERLHFATNSFHVSESAGFVGCGCLFRKRSFQSTHGYLPLAQAYGMEEADLSLKLLDQGDRIAKVSGLYVFHNCDRGVRHADPRTNASQIANIALLAFLRYPLIYWPFGLFQVLNRVKFCVASRRFAGIVRGVLSIPWVLWKHRANRSAVQVNTVRELMRIRRFPRKIFEEESDVVPAREAGESDEI